MVPDCCIVCNKRVLPRRLGRSLFGTQHTSMNVWMLESFVYATVGWVCFSPFVSCSNPWWVAQHTRGQAREVYAYVGSASPNRFPVWFTVRNLFLGRLFRYCSKLTGQPHRKLTSCRFSAWVLQEQLTSNDRLFWENSDTLKWSFTEMVD